MKTFWNNIQPIWHKYKYLVIVFSILIFATMIMVLSLPPESQTKQPTDATQGIESSTTETEEPTSIYSDYTTLFGENSLSTALVGKKYQDFSEYDKQVLQDVVTKCGGEITINTMSITLSGEDGRKALYYPDETRIIVDSEGRASGTRWIDTELSGLLPQLELAVFQCVATEEVFAVKYTTEDSSVFSAYYNQLQSIGFNIEPFISDILFSAKNAEGYEVSVSYSNNLFTIMLKQPSTEIT